MFDREACQQRTQWYQNARFGMFIHWGLYAIPARGEWVRSTEQMPQEAYLPFFHEFNPTDFAPKEWAKAARNAGIKYAVLTAKHHDGFCLFDSGLTNFKSTNTPFGRDIVREFLDAFRAEGLRVGLYYSLLDWHHPDYPHYGDRYHPLRNDIREKDIPRDFDRYLRYMHGQIRELCTRYGKLDILWFDFSYKGDNQDMTGEAWRAAELVRMVRSLQPDVILDNRLEGSGEGFGSLATSHPSEYCGDFVSPEQIIPPESLTVLDQIGRWMKKNGTSICGCRASAFPKPENGRITQNGNTVYYHIMENAIGSIPLYGIPKDRIQSARLLEDGRELKIQDNWIVNNYPDMAFLDISAGADLPDPTDTVVEIRLKE